MHKISGIVRYTFVEIFRNKVYHVLLLFAAVLIGSAFLFGSLGGQQWPRLITDMGLVSIETLSLVVAVFAAVTLVLEEMESRTLYLILTRPVARYHFVLGRYFGLMAVISVTYGLMSLAHIVLMRCTHVPVDAHYALALYYSWEKILLITALALFFSLFATSTVSAVSFTLFFWVLGHFSSEIRYLGNRSGEPVVRALCKVFYYLAPNFQVMNLRDLPPQTFSGSALWAAAGYGLSYTAVCLALTVWLFRRREF